jgi:hypothetical protein
VDRTAFPPRAPAGLPYPAATYGRSRLRMVHHGEARVSLGQARFVVSPRPWEAEHIRVRSDLYLMIGDDLLSANGRLTMRHRCPLMPLRGVCRITDCVLGGSAHWLGGKDGSGGGVIVPATGVG